MMSSNRYVFLLKDSLIESSVANGGLTIISLRNAATNASSKYLLSARNEGKKELYELTCYNEPHRSWFINESVSSDGKLFLPTRIDPLFLALPYLERHCVNHAVPVEQIFIDPEFPDVQHLQRTIDPTMLRMVTDEKSTGTIRAYKYNEEKAMQWLRAKCGQLEIVLGNARQQTGARSQNFVKEEKENDHAADSCALQMAHGIVSDYVSLEMGKKLAIALGFPADNVAKKRKSGVNLEAAQLKKIKKEDNHETTPIKIPVAEKKVSAKAKALAKAATGSKSISSFFRK